MGRFNGNNNQGTLEQFLERSAFSADAYPTQGSDIYVRPVRDFNFAERTLYGKINKLHNPIQVRRENLVPVARQPEGGGQLRALNFVADAFEAFMVQWQGLSLRGRLDDTDPILYELVPVKAYVDYNEAYTAYRIGLRNSFLQNYLTEDRDTAIINFESFLEIFFKYVGELSNTVPVTRSAFIPSKFASPLISGLCIEVGSFDASDDAVKERFIESPNFEYYKLVARDKGFSIDKQAPWRLIADIASPQMLRFSANYGQNTERRVLAQSYGRVGGTDIRELIDLAVDTYNAVVRRRPVLRLPTPLCNMEPHYLERVVVRRAQIVSDHPLLYWLDKYINIRYNEQRKPISDGAMTEIRKVVPDLARDTTEAYCITYINNHIKTFDNFKGSYAQRVLDRRNARNNTRTHPTY